MKVLLTQSGWGGAAFALHVEEGSEFVPVSVLSTFEELFRLRDFASELGDALKDGDLGLV
ncbi:MAG: hypothetical protein AAF368_02475 [Planctomycetota bacterium]